MNNNLKFIQKKKVVLIYGFSIVGVTTLFIFGLLNTFTMANTMMGIIEIIATIIIAINLFWFQRKNDIHLASEVTLAVLFVVLIGLYFSGGFGGTSGSFWYFTMPIVAFFLLGRKGGIVWTIALLIVTTIIFFLIPPNVRIYTFVETSQLVFSVLVVSALVYLYSDINEEIEQYLVIREAALAKNSEKLVSEEYQLASEKDEVQSKNNELENIKSAMINLLEDARESETSLQIERDRSQGIISSMGEGLLAVDENAMVTIINPAAEKMLDIRAKDAVGKPWYEVVVSMNGDSVTPIAERTFNRTLKYGEAFITDLSADHYYKTRKGRIFPVVSITAPLRSGDKIIGAVKVFRDATNEKEQKAIIERTVIERTKELNEERVKLRSSIESINVGFIMTDTKGTVVEINSAARRIVCQPGESSQPRGLISLTETNLLECNINTIQATFEGILDFKEQVKRCIDEKKPIEMKEVQLGARFVDLFFSPITMMQEGLSVIGAVVLVQDETEARILSRSKDEFFSIASHELRTPLTAIRGNTSMIMDYYAGELKDENIKSMIADIHESSLRLIGIVNDFLDLSRLEQKRIEFKKEYVDMVDLSKEVFEELRPNASSNVQLVVNEPSSPVPQVLADKNRTKEVIINLAGNALKFTQNGSVSVHFEVKDKTLVVYITDTGRGLSPENQNLLFRKFQQANDNLLTRDTTKGTGLGLYISKLMIEGMGGKIWLENSTLGKGSTFAFSIPIV